MTDWAKKSRVLDYYLEAGEMLRFAFDGTVQELLQHHLDKKSQWPSHLCIRKMEKFLSYLKSKAIHYTEPYAIRFGNDPKTFSLVWNYGGGEGLIVFSENSKSCDFMELNQIDVSDTSVENLSYNKQATNFSFSDIDKDPLLVDDFCDQLFVAKNNFYADTFSVADQIFYFLNQLSALAKKNNIILPYPEPINIDQPVRRVSVSWKFFQHTSLDNGNHSRRYFPKFAMINFWVNKITGDLFASDVNLLPSNYDIEHLGKTENTYIIMPKPLQEDEGDWKLFLEKSFRKCHHTREAWDGDKEKFLQTICYTYSEGKE